MEPRGKQLGPTAPGELRPKLPSLSGFKNNFKNSSESGWGKREPVSDRNREIPSALSRMCKRAQEGLLNSASESMWEGVLLSVEPGWLPCVA